MSEPTWILPACPRCSVPRARIFERPCWRNAARTSEKRGKRCYIWTGCVHAQPSLGAPIVEADAPEVQATEAAWAKRRVEVFLAAFGHLPRDQQETAAADRGVQLPPAESGPAQHEHTTNENK